MPLVYLFDAAGPVVFVVLAVFRSDVLDVGVPVFALALADGLLVFFPVFAGSFDWSRRVEGVLGALLGVDGFPVGLVVFAFLLVDAVSVLLSVSEIVLAGSLEVGVIAARGCAVGVRWVGWCEFYSALCARLGFVVCHVALLDRSPVHVEDSLPVEDASRSGDDVCEVCCAVGALHCYVLRSPGH